MNKTASRFLQHSGNKPSRVGLGLIFRVRVGRGDQHRTILKIYDLMRSANCSETALQRFWELSNGRLAATAAALAIKERMPTLYRHLMAGARQQGGRVLPTVFRSLLKEYAKQNRKA